LHGRTSRAWNLAERTTGRYVFSRAADRAIRSDAHFWATLNYVHHNPVRHGYVTRWTDWPWSSANDYLRSIGREEATRLWQRHPLLDYGAGWDDPDL
jgi:putative transposase